MSYLEGKSASWWLDVKAVMDCNGIKDAKELEDRLDQNQTPVPTVRVTIPQGIAHSVFESNLTNDAPIPPKPTIGRIVHYITGEGQELPAIIVAASSFTPEQWVYVKAFVWGDRRQDISDFAMYDGENKKAVRTWHWPEQDKE